MPDWLRIALHKRTVARSLWFAVVVGALLIAINHGDAILEGEVDAGRLLRMALTLTVPYLVSTFSSVAATLETRRKPPRTGAP